MKSINDAIVPLFSREKSAKLLIAKIQVSIGCQLNAISCSRVDHSGDGRNAMRSISAFVYIISLNRLEKHKINCKISASERKSPTRRSNRFDQLLLLFRLISCFWLFLLFFLFVYFNHSQKFLMSAMLRIEWPHIDFSQFAHSHTRSHSRANRRTNIDGETKT